MKRLEKALAVLARTQRQLFATGDVPLAYEDRDRAIIDVLAAYGEVLEAREAEGPPTAAPELLAVLRSLADAADEP